MQANTQGYEYAGVLAAWGKISREMNDVEGGRKDVKAGT